MTLPQKPKSWKQFILAEEGEIGDYPERAETLRDLRKYFKDLVVELEKLHRWLVNQHINLSEDCEKCDLLDYPIAQLKEVLESLK